MHHRRPEESEFVMAEVQDIAFLDCQCPACQVNAFEKLRYHLDCPGARHDGDGREFFHHAGNQCRMVGLQMVNHQVVRNSFPKCFRKILLPFVRLPFVYGVEDCDLVVNDNVRVVGYSVRYNVLTFKQIQVLVVCTYIEGVRTEFSNHIL